ncbi:raffinose synthase or seed imbibition protein Sip1-domain-containing protein [Pestalotiopsis sp. NC0098]|nr:raffinose synthase or seed imbibition protein Sip1-domain-containing protein [Pestalotiopsis sp. NC0098]
MAEPVTCVNGKREPVVATYPPLGVVTKLTATTINFSCVLKDVLGSQDAAWEVKLFYTSIDSHEWEEHDLDPSEATLFEPYNRNSARELSRVFEANIEISDVVRFRLMFRRNLGAPWIEVGAHPECEGILIPAPKGQTKISLDLHHHMHELNPELRSKLLDDGADTRVVSWMVEAPVEAASGESPYMTQVMFGKPFGGQFLRWSAISRNTTSWMAPRQGRNYFKLDVAAITCSFMNHRGEHLVVLGLSGLEDVMAIFGDNNEGALMIKIRNERHTPGYGRVIVAAGSEFEATLHSALGQARTIFGCTDRPLGDGSRSQKEFGQDWADNWINGLIYSPSNHLRHKHTEQEITESLNALSAKGITVSGLVLDDTWQNVDPERPSRFHAGLVDFEASKDAFKSGLRHAVAEIKGRHKSVRSVIVEHPIFGSWGGISRSNDSGGSVQKTYETIDVQRSEAIQSDQKTLLTLSLVAPENAQRFFHDYYEFLTSSDISAVRVDGVYMLETLASAKDRCSLAEVYLDAQSSAASTAFPGGTMSTMSLSPSSLLNNLKASHRPIVKNIGIFPDHRKYVFNNAHNAWLSNGIGNLPDWGAIGSTKDHGAFHAAARAISGGPIQISSFDGTDDGDLEIFQQITAITARGKTVALRPSGIGRATNPYISFGDNALLKISNTHNVGKMPVSILGIFNVSDRPISELLQLRDFANIDPTMSYAVRSECGRTSKPVKVDSSLLLSIDVDVSQYAFLCAYPLTALIHNDNNDIVYMTVLGLQKKMINVAAIISSTFGVEDNAPTAKTVVKGFGFLDFYISDLPKRSIGENTCKIQVQGKSVVPSTDIVCVNDRVMTLDLESIWKEQKLEGSTDEIYVDVSLYS